MAKEITIRMSTASINDAIKELRRMKEDFERKLDLFVRMLANDGVEIAKTTYAQSNHPLVADVILSIDKKSGDVIEATINITGQDVLFVEFGAGIHYNPTNPEHASKYGMGVGTYEPNKGHAFEDGWWYYVDETKSEARYTHGTRATSPMLQASNNYRNNAILMALQLFRS